MNKKEKRFSSLEHLWYQSYRLEKMNIIDDVRIGFSIDGFGDDPSLVIYLFAIL